jgi:hypothetical protein
MKTLTKGYTNVSQATTTDLVRSNYNLSFKDSYVPIAEPSKAQARAKDISATRKLWKNITSATQKAREFFHLNVTNPSGIRFRGSVTDEASRRVTRKGVRPAGFTVSSEGWDYVSDPADTAAPDYSLAYNITLSVQYEEDDLVTAGIIEERIERLISFLTKNDGGSSRITELMNGSYAEVN